ncbi:MAG: ABC transporter permease [Alphaproteobacteria bacterium]|nr:ABC transporter permease [Alphaproteobacteria bacterium]
MKNQVNNKKFFIEYKTQKERDVLLTLTGDFIHFEDAVFKNNLLNILLNNNLKSLIIQADKLTSWDTTLTSFLYRIIKFCQSKNIIIKYENIPDELTKLLQLALTVDRKPVQPTENKVSFLEDIGEKSIFIFQTIKKGMSFIQETLFSFGRLFKKKAVVRFVDFISVMNECGPKALLIVSLISFMVGLILAFVGSIQLKLFGAEIYVASLVTIGMIRIMGAIMAGIIMSGRTGASYAASIGTMQVNEELDALKTMGISVIDFLVLPRILSLIITMPILVMLADFMGILGGAFVGIALLNIPSSEYFKYAIDAFGLTNFLVGIFHGFIFGFIIAICGCYYGINSGKNADSVGLATTKAVVSSIVWMIVLTGLITWAFSVMGI